MGAYHLPADARFTCRSCTNCCRHWTVTVPDEERARLAAHDWAAEDPALAGATLFDAAPAGPGGAARYTIHLKGDGACPFLAPDGRCRVHARFGARAKPLVCQIFPFTFTETPGATFVGMRFACPTVTRGEGAPIAAERESVKDLARAFAKELGGRAPAATVDAGGGHEIDWRDATAIDAAFATAFDGPEDAPSDLPLATRVERAARLLRQLQDIDLGKIRGNIGEFLELTAGEPTPPDAAPADAGAGAAVRPPRAGERLLFRRFLNLLVLREYRGQTGGVGLRWRAFLDSLHVHFERGSLPLAGLPSPVPLSAVPSVASPVTEPAVAELLARFVRVRRHAKAYIAGGFHAWGQLAGLGFLLLTLPALCWFARASAAARGATTTALDDFRFAAVYLDFTLGASDLFDRASVRLQLAPLVAPDAALRLFQWLAR
ncbi:MAG: YkgJ family cysteine cluster protein [Planctomycetes bacterium]|nr:YkgJ family cysteine cluster protein [Planctomycetota bacterium]